MVLQLVRYSGTYWHGTAACAVQWDLLAWYFSLCGTVRTTGMVLQLTVTDKSKGKFMQGIEGTVPVVLNLDIT